MALSTLAELKDAIVRWSKRDNLSASLDDIILVAEQWIFRHARVREMEVALNLSVSTTAAVPTGFLGLKHARLSGTPNIPLQVMAPDELYSAYPTRSAIGVPQFIAVDGDEFVFGPVPAAQYTLFGRYYAKPTSVLTSNTFLAAYPDLYLYSSLYELESFMKNDKRMAVWEPKRDKAVMDANSASRAVNFSGPLTMRVV